MAEHFDTNSTTYKDDCVELFWNPNPEGGDSCNMFEINCIGNLLSVYNNFERSIHERDSRTMVPHIAQSIKGTVNNDDDLDSGWIIEVAVRFSDYPELSKRQVPVDGDMWRVGLNRCGGKTNPQSSQWSPCVIQNADSTRLMILEGLFLAANQCVKWYLIFTFFRKKLFIPAFFTLRGYYLIKEEELIQRKRRFFK